MFITIALLTPGDSLPKTPTFPNADKVVHFGIFAVLTLLWSRVGTIDSTGRLRKSRLGTNLLVFTLFFPILVEYLQKFVPNRSFDYNDIVANLVGGIFGFLVFIILYKAESKLV